MRCRNNRSLPAGRPHATLRGLRNPVPPIRPRPSPVPERDPDPPMPASALRAPVSAYPHPTDARRSADWRTRAACNGLPDEAVSARRAARWSSA